MLNSYSSSSIKTNNLFKVNAVTGNMLKNFPKSFFKRFKLDGDMATQLFDEEQPHLSKFTREYYENSCDSYMKEEKRHVVIIQMMMSGESEVLAEIMWKDDFDELFV